VEKLSRLEVPVIVAVNKIDLSDQERVGALLAEWKERLPEADVIPVSAKEKFNLDSVLDAIVAKLPASPPWFDKDSFTDRNLRFFASEIFREKILENYRDEIPYSCQVEIEQFKEGDERYDISAVIYVMRDSQKGIIIGKGGSALKRTATAARMEMEDFFQKKVFLTTYVKVDPDWRDKKMELRKFGYEE
jgi:GTP-binding protein Era